MPGASRGFDPSAAVVELGGIVDELLSTLRFVTRSSCLGAHPHVVPGIRYGMTERTRTAEEQVVNASARPDPASHTRNDPTGPVGYRGAMAAGGNVLLAFWLLLAPTILGYERAGEGLRNYWNGFAVGGALLILALARVAMPVRLLAPAYLAAASGAWLVLSPLVLDNGAGPNHPVATVNDVAVGLAVLALSFAGLVASRRDAARAHNGSSSP
jgi:hypothetical protein